MILEIFSIETRERLDLVRTYDFCQYEEVFNGFGKFTLTVPYTEKSLKYLTDKNFLLLDKEVLGVIKYRGKITEEMSTVDIKGFLINHVLNYRSFLKTTSYSGKRVDVVRNMVNDLLIQNGDPRRNIDFISLSTNVEFIPDSDIISCQNTGKKLGDVIQELLEPVGYGYELIPNIEKYNEEADMLTNISSLEFRVIKPKNRTIGNSDGNTPVVFSMEMNNLKRLLFEEDSTTACSVAIVAGEGQGQERKLLEVGETENSGIKRIELYVDARDLQSEGENRDVIPENQYMEMMRQRGEEYLEENKVFRSFDGTVIEGSMSYEYGKDFFKGDYVTIVDREMDLAIDAKITKVTKSSTKTGEILDITFGNERMNIRRLLNKKGVV